MMYDHAERATVILNDLVEYTGQDPTLVRARCKSAYTELAWLWHEGGKDDVLKYYRDTNLYAFDLTMYQSMMVPNVNYYTQEAKERKFKKILDLGGGIGEYTIRLLQETDAEVTYLDLKGSKTLEYAKWRFDKHKVKPHIVFEDYKWQNEDWDAVVAMDVLEHFEDPKPTIEALKEKAKFIYANPEQIQYNAFYPQHISRFDLDGFFKVGINLYENRSDPYSQIIKGPIK